LLLRRIPGLQQVVVNLGVIDRPDSRVGIGVGREQGPLSVRIKLHRFGEKSHARHLRHPLIHQKQRHRIVAFFELRQSVQRVFSRLRPQNPIAIRIAVPQIALYRPQNLGIVIDG